MEKVFDAYAICKSLKKKVLCKCSKQAAKLNYRAALNGVI